ncbi:hydroxymethylbilane synthase [Geodermatophilus sp. URMC 62]|uniref:hydroxymethylbilane synthase n=1 Tax=Geodermatophilus sp. URMC 62 TaxID=3423414 RepID=UPI00406BFC5D
MSRSPDASPSLRVGTRSSPMALAQVERLKAELAGAQPEVAVEVVALTTSGDRWQGNLSALGGKGAFTKELDQALVAGTVDVVVHCLKDVPGDRPLPAGTRFACFLERDDVRDALIHPGKLQLAAMPTGSVIGTSSVRRIAQLHRYFPQLKTVPIRGNANSRLGKLDRGDFDALILAYSGLCRIGMAQRVTQILSLETMFPPIGAGILALQCREDDFQTLDILRSLNHHPTAMVVQAERTLLYALKGHCNSPIAGHAAASVDGALHLRGQVFSEDGSALIAADQAGPIEQAEDLGRSVAADLLGQGARKLIDASAP